MLMPITGCIFLPNISPKEVPSAKPYSLLVVPTTRDSPHETREAKLMRMRRNIQVHHYALDDRGCPIPVNPFSKDVPGNDPSVLNHRNV